MRELAEGVGYMLVGMVVGTLVIVGAGALASMAPPRDAVQYNVKAYGDVLCANKERTSCGMRLSNCADAMVYECVTDFRYEQREPR